MNNSFESANFIEFVIYHDVRVESQHDVKLKKRESTAPNSPNQVLGPVIQNVVSTCSLNCKLNLKEISELMKNSEYNPKKFRAMMIRLRNPKITANVFTSGKLRQEGKMVVLGANNEYDSLIAARKVARMIQKIKPEVEFKDFKIQNIVAYCNLDTGIVFDKFLLKHRNSPLGKCHYEDEFFSSAINFKIENSKVTTQIFAKGKLVITGAKSRTEIKEAFDKVRSLICSTTDGEKNALKETK